MARIFRLWEKKRGDRRTGSKFVGTLGEALFFGILFLLGSVSLTYLIITHVRSPNLDALELGSGYGFWLMIVVAASFVLIGGGGLILTVLQVGTSAERRSALAKRAANLDLMGDTPASAREFPHVPSDANLTNSPGVKLRYRLPVTHSQIWSLTLAAAFCLVWNGILSVLLTVVINSLVVGQPNWLLAAFAVPSLTIGIWSVFNFVERMLVHTGIGPTNVEISDHPLHPGGRYQVVVSQGGRLKLKWFEMLLICDEEATFHQGTDVRTEAQCVVHRQLVRLEELSIDSGTPFEHLCDLEIPAEVMHSFRGKYNAIHWKLVVRGSGWRWQKFDRSFPLVILPTSYEPSSTEPRAPRQYRSNQHQSGRFDDGQLGASQYEAGQLRPRPAANETAGLDRDRS